MKYPEITKLYKYREYSERNVRMVAKKEAWFAIPDTFNDPFDCNMIPFGSKTPEDAQYQLFSVIDRLYEPAEAEQKKMQHLMSFNENINIEDNSLQKHFDESKSIGVYSLSEDPKQLLMWAHYASNHTGFYVEYAREPNPLNILSHVMCRPVDYCLDYPNLYRETDLTSVNLFTKSEDWKYEKEWRIVSRQGNRVEDILVPPVTGIIFGLKMPNEHREFIFETLKHDNNIRFYECVRVPNKFALDLVEIDL
uniref:DUF2971 domain-containing protein n=1 Tax=Thaumasiovibrio occultus TaxID=1891184 RepID=UPI00131E00D9|nr:DUF2971 domain-containing protein [Thaumasiovibrio occultus]